MSRKSRFNEASATIEITDETVEAMMHPKCVDVIKTTNINSKKHGIVQIFTIKPNGNYSKSMLMAMAINNPGYVIFHPERDCFYLNYYSYVNLLYGCSPHFYQCFLVALKKSDNYNSYFDAMKKYLRKFSSLQMLQDE